MKSRTAINVAVIGSDLNTNWAPTRGWAQTKSADKPANNMEIIHEKLKADKKLVVAKYMDLTESEAKNFWPVYDAYQKDLRRFTIGWAACSRAMPQSTAVSRSPTKDGQCHGPRDAV